MFYVCILGYDQDVQALRVVLSDDDSGAPLQTIEADTWIEAREVVDDQHLRHVPGFGWFLKS